MAFCKAMNNFTVNEKGNITNSLEGSADKCLGMVNLWNNAIGKRGGGKGGKGFGKGFGKGGNNSSCEIDENKLNEGNHEVGISNQDESILPSKNDEYTDISDDNNSEN